MPNRYENNYFLCAGKEFEQFWQDYLQTGSKNILFIMGIGFDPRSLHCLEIIHKHKSSNSFDYKIIEYDDKFESKPQLKKLLKNNTDSLAEYVPHKDWNSKLIHMKNKTGLDISVQSSKSISESVLENHSDIILDISAMPNGVYFPIVRNILDFIRKKKTKSDTFINFHLIVSENPEFDAQIKEIRTNNNVTYMHKFSAKLQLESNKELRKVWVPLLGENQKSQLETINAEIEPKEICPVFPMPSIDPYRCKKLLIDYRELLFETLVIEPRNYIYCSEKNPFETCRKLYKTSHNYYDSFRPLKGCQVVISPLSSKLLCVGALLATYELYTEESNVGIVYVENQTYDIDGAVDIDKIKEKSVPFTMWLTGECYE